MERLLVAAAIVLVVAVVAVVVRRRRQVDPPTQRRFAVPTQLDRSSFPRPDAPWLVVVFSSASCDVCRSVVAKSEVLASADVAVADVGYEAERGLHDRYSIEAVPTTLIADSRGVVVASFLGPVTATDLWAAVAEARAPGSTPRSCTH